MGDRNLQFLQWDQVPGSFVRNLIVRDKCFSYNIASKYEPATSSGISAEETPAMLFSDVAPS